MDGKKVAILGSGWLGMALVERLVFGGWEVHASYRQASTGAKIERLGGRAHWLDLPEETASLDEFLSDARALIVTLPPGGRRHAERTTERYLATFAPLAGKLAGLHTVYTSSTGVYGRATEGIATEATPALPDTHSGRAVVAAEQWLSERADELTILRLAGLYGPDRDPVSFFRNRQEVANGEAPVNMVHRDDVVMAIEGAVEQRLKGIFNVCAATHPTKRAFYGERLRRANMHLPRFLVSGKRHKVIDSSALRQRLGWKPRHDDLMT